MARRIKKTRRIASVPVASMGDIAFLLIIFFLLLSDFNKDKKYPMDLPVSGQVKKVEKHISARVDIDKEGNIYLDAKRVEDSKEVESELTELLKDTISDDQRHVQFKCDSSQTKAVFEPVLQAIAQAGGIIEAVGEKEQER